MASRFSIAIEIAVIVTVAVIVITIAVIVTVAIVIIAIAVIALVILSDWSQPRI